MKKLFNYALLAAALLVGVNVNAETVFKVEGDEASYSTLADAIAAVSENGVITVNDAYKVPEGVYDLKGATLKSSKAGTVRAFTLDSLGRITGHLEFKNGAIQDISFTNQSPKVAPKSELVLNLNEGSTVTVANGTWVTASFIGGAVVAKGGTLTVSTFTDCALTVTGATFTAYPILEGTATIETITKGTFPLANLEDVRAKMSGDGNYLFRKAKTCVVNPESNAIVQINDNEKFLTLADAVAFASATDNVKVIVDKVAAAQTVNVGGVTVDLDGKTIEYAGTEAKPIEKTTLTISAGATVKNGTVVGNTHNTGNVLSITSAAARLVNMTIKGKVSLTQGIYSNVTFKDGKVEIAGGSFDKDCAFGNDVTFSGGTFAPELQATVSANLATGYEIYTNLRGELLVVKSGSISTTPIAEVGGQKYRSLQDAFDAAADGQTIKMIGDKVQINTIESVELNEAKDITLDLNGYNIVFNNPDAKTALKATMFTLYKGILRIKGGNIINETPVMNQEDYKAQGGGSVRCFYVLGGDEKTQVSGEKLSAYSTQLWIGEDVTVDCVYGKTGVEVYNKVGMVDNGNSAYGAYINVAGKMHGEKYGIQMSGTISVVPEDGEDARNYNFPWYVVEKTGEVYSNASATVKGGVGIYMGGFGILDIYGYVHGATGVYVKNGDVEIVDAVIASDYNGDFAPATNTGSSVEGGGSAIVIVTNANTYGDIDVTISGDTKITGGSGYGIEEDVNFKEGSEGTSQIDALKIEGGTIESGDKGSIVITDDTEDHNVLVITGGASGGTIEVGKAGEGTTETPIENFIPSGGEENYHVTVIQDPENPDKTITIVSSGAAPTEKAYTNTEFNDLLDETSISVGENSEDLSLTNDLTLGEIAMLHANSITIPSGKTLKADHIIMGADAVITVKAGGKLIITGKEGFKDYAVTNLVIEDDAIFLFNPENVSNKHPYATVKQNLAIMKNTGVVGVDCVYEYIWQNIGIPTIDGNYGIEPQNVTLFNAWDRDRGWVAAPAKEMRKPFEGLHIASIQETAIPYVFTGELAGNMNYEVDINKNGYYLYANSWTAPLATSVILENLKTQGEGGKMTAAVYFYQPNNQEVGGEQINEAMYTAITPAYLNSLTNEEVKKYFSTIKPMQGFFIATLAPVHFTLSYAENIWESNKPVSGAPRFEANEAMNAVRVRISAENGRTDYVYLNDAQDMSAAKMMNARPNLNVYAQTEEGQFAVLSAETLEGVKVNFQSNSKLNYTMTFDMVEGETYYMRDNLNGAVVEMVEGNLYHFVAEPNSNIENRFEVIAGAQAPTDMQKTNVAVKATKTMVNGQVVISDGQRFINILGVEVK